MRIHVLYKLFADAIGEPATTPAQTDVIDEPELHTVPDGAMGEPSVPPVPDAIGEPSLLLVSGAISEPDVCTLPDAISEPGWSIVIHRLRVETMSRTEPSIRCSYHFPMVTRSLRRPVLSVPDPSIGVPCSTITLFPKAERIFFWARIRSSA